MNSESKDSKSILINALPIFSKQRYPNRTTVRGIFVLNRFSTMCKTFINFMVDNLTNLCYNGIIIKRKEKMKLRNKKTGGLANCEPITVSTDAGWHDYYSLAELNEEWEDCAQKEPLIKDEKIRKAIRAWADANQIEEFLYDKDEDCIYTPYGSDNTDIRVSISFDECDVLEDLEHRRLYTITELCGEVK